MENMLYYQVLVIPDKTYKYLIIKVFLRHKGYIKFTWQKNIPDEGLGWYGLSFDIHGENINLAIIKSIEKLFNGFSYKAGPNEVVKILEKNNVFPQDIFSKVEKAVICQ